MPTGDARLERKVFANLQTWHQIELLEDEADPLAAQLGTRTVAHADQALARNDDFTAVSRVECRGKVQKRTLAAAGFAGQRQRLPRWQIKIDTAQDVNGPLRRWVGL
ncbi:hypothetical protein GCM10007908_18410 [Rhizobium albus]|nr:hypothetical protein GCM10007908_18410 [Rhizobium albus]